MLRQVSPIFDTKALGYTSSLVAMRVSEDKLAAAAEVVNAHPGVSHNYRRTHEFNMWFTIAVPAGSDLQAHVDALHALAGAESTRMLPTLRLFKIGVTLDMTGERAIDQSVITVRCSSGVKRELRRPQSSTPNGSMSASGQCPKSQWGAQRAVRANCSTSACQLSQKSSLMRHRLAWHFTCSAALNAVSPGEKLKTSARPVRSMARRTASISGSLSW